MEDKILILDIPVLHQGYFNLFEKLAPQVRELYILGPEILEDFPVLKKEIRRLQPELVRELINSRHLFEYVALADKNLIKSLRRRHIITANDKISRDVVDKYFFRDSVTYESVFLRWDESHISSSTDVKYDRISENPRDIRIIKRASEKAKESPDWWRQVGAIFISSALPYDVEAHNIHVPEGYTNYALGDIRDFTEPGEKPEISSALHSEQVIIVWAARKGIALEGGKLYVTAFPCPVCAKLIAYSGIRTCYFSSGYANFDGERVLKAKGVELVWVKVPEVKNGKK